MISLKDLSLVLRPKTSETVSSAYKCRKTVRNGEGAAREQTSSIMFVDECIVCVCVSLGMSAADSSWCELVLHVDYFAWFITASPQASVRSQINISIFPTRVDLSAFHCHRY